MNVELMLLTVLQGLRTQILDAGMLFFTHLGDAGFIWAALTAVLLVFRRTRRVGCVLAAALLVDAVLCNLILKPLVARIRPCDILADEETVGVGCTAAGRSDRFLADVSLCPLPDGHHRRCTGGRRLRMDRGEAGGNVLAEELCKE